MKRWETGLKEGTDIHANFELQQKLCKGFGLVQFFIISLLKFKRIGKIAHKTTENTTIRRSNITIPLVHIYVGAEQNEDKDVLSPIAGQQQGKDNHNEQLKHRPH